MPCNPQTTKPVDLCAEILAKFVKQEDLQSLEQESANQIINAEIAEGKWEDEQNLKFIVFIDYHSKIFSSKQRRKTEKIFKILSNHLGNRTPAQCRSHYQKIMIKYKTIAKLRKYFKEYFGEELYNKEYQMFVQNWKSQKEAENEDKQEGLKKQMSEAAVQTEPMPDMQEQFQQMMNMLQMQQWFNPFYFQMASGWGENHHSEM